MLSSGAVISMVVLLAGGCVPTDRVPTLPIQYTDFIHQAAKAESVVRVKEGRRESSRQTPLVYLQVIEHIAGKPIQDDIVVAASVWDVVAPATLTRDRTTFLLNMSNREEIMCIQYNGIPLRHQGCAGMLPVVDDAIPKNYAIDYDLYSCDEAVPMSWVRAQLSRKDGAK